MSPDRAPSRYRRRRRWPILVVLALLLAGGIVVWTSALKPAPAQATGCNEPGPPPTTSTPASGSGRSRAAGTSEAPSAAATTSTPARTTGSVATGSAAASSAAPGTTQATTTLGTFTDPNVLAATRPADPGQVPLTVFNASAVIGQAMTVTDQLREAGFSSIRRQANDPLYPAFDLHCYGEIRFGWAGTAEARTVLVVAPCAQLVIDGRADNSVDLSLGKLYTIEPISTQVVAELTQIKNASAPPPVIEGQTISVRTVPPIPPLPSRSGCPA